MAFTLGDQLTLGVSGVDSAIDQTEHRSAVGPVRRDRLLVGFVRRKIGPPPRVAELPGFRDALAEVSDHLLDVLRGNRTDIVACRKRLGAGERHGRRRRLVDVRRKYGLHAPLIGARDPQVPEFRRDPLLAAGNHQGDRTGVQPRVGCLKDRLVVDRGAKLGTPAFQSYLVPTAAVVLGDRLDNRLPRPAVVAVDFRLTRCSNAEQVAVFQIVGAFLTKYDAADRPTLVAWIGCLHFHFEREVREAPAPNHQPLVAAVGISAPRQNAVFGNPAATRGSPPFGLELREVVA